MKRVAASAVVCAALMVSPVGGDVRDEVGDLAPAIVNGDRYIGPIIARQVGGGAER